MKNSGLLFSFILTIFYVNTLRGQMPSPPQLQPGEKWTNLWSVSYDKQNFGGIRYLVQDPVNPANLCAILQGQQDSNDAYGDNKYTYYSYSNDFGNTWTANVLDTSVDNIGFPTIALQNGIPIIAVHLNGGQTGVFFKDQSFGASMFQMFSRPQNSGGSWPGISGTSNGNIVWTGYANLAGSMYATYNGSSWTDWIYYSIQSATASVEAGSNGLVSLYGIVNGGLSYFKSTDNGITFDNGSEIFKSMVINNDTVIVKTDGGFQSVYSGETLHFIFAVNKPTFDYLPNVNIFNSPRILHWSSNTGITQIAGDFNIPNLDDTIKNSRYNSTLCHPSIGITQDGKLVCTYTVFSKGNTQIVQNGDTVNTGEIYISFSNDDGITWTYPINITNTPYVDEKESSILRSAIGNYTYVYYIRDLRAGYWILNRDWGKAPVYGIVNKIDPTIGINHLNNIINDFELYQNYPNPFNPTTKINYELRVSNYVSLIVYDILGNKISDLINEKQNAGSYSVNFDATNFPSGVYYYKLSAGDFSETKKMMLLK